MPVFSSYPRPVHQQHPKCHLSHVTSLRPQGHHGRPQVSPYISLLAHMEKRGGGKKQGPSLNLRDTDS